MTNLNDILKIDTPENVTFDYDVAGIGSRFLAALVDTALIVISQLLIIGTILLIALFIFKIEFSNTEVLSWGLAVFSIISFLFLWGYYIFFEILWNGQTPGKRVVGVRVIRVDGTPITVSEAVIRNLVRVIDFMPMAYGVGVVSMFINSNSRRVGDLAAGTIVVHDRPVQELDYHPAAQLHMIDTLVSRNDVPQGFPFERVTQNELHLIEEFLTRRKELSNRLPLARHILVSITTRLEIPQESVQYNRAEEILATIYKIRQVVSNE